MTTKVLECALELRRGSCTVPPGRVMRVARLLALALKFERLLGQGAIADYACLARLGQVSRARISQIMNLVYLAPDIQEEILFAPRTVRGRDVIHLGQLQPIALVLDWQRQRLLWRELLGRSGTGTPGADNAPQAEPVPGAPARPAARVVPRSAGKNGATVAITGKEYDGQV